MRDLEPIVREVAEAWMTGMLERLEEANRGPHRSPCSRCSTSPLRDALGTFGALPHHLVHPLISRLHSVVDDEAGRVLSERLEELRLAWRERLDLDEDGDPPSVEWYELVASEHDTARQLEVEAAEFSRASESVEVVSALRAFTEERAEIGADAVDRLVMRALDRLDDMGPDTALLDAGERAGLDAGISSILERWFLWLPSGAWRRTPAIPNGSRCAPCDASPFTFGGIHGAAHGLVAGLDELVEKHVETYGGPRVEPPGHGYLAEYRDEVSRHARATLDAHAYAIHRALRLHVLLPVESDIHRAAAHLLVLPDPSEGGAEPGGSR